MKIRHCLTLAALFATVAATAQAQRVSASPIAFSVFAGADIPTGSGSNDVNTGYTAGVGVDYRAPANAMLGFRAEGLYAHFSSKTQVAGFDASMSDLGANANAVVWFPMTAPSSFSPYVTAGPSFSHLTFNAKSGSTTISESQNKWGFNAGGGIEFAVGELGARVDVRYKRISMDAGDTYTSVPITFGIRF